MKAIKLFIVVVVVFVTLGLNGWGQESSSGKNDYGIVAGQILDPETGKPVSERFFIRFNYVLYKGEYPTEFNAITIPPAYPIPDVRFSNLPGKIGYSLITDSKGYFKRKFAPGTYGIIIAPENIESLRYCTELDPMDPRMPNQDKLSLTFIIKVERGKITRFNKKAILGGRIKVNLVDKYGNIINHNTYFKPGTVIDIDCYKPNLSEKRKFSFIDNTDRMSPSLLPGIYKVELRLRGPIKGFKKYISENVLVKKMETTDINIVIDPIDSELKDILL